MLFESLKSQMITKINKNNRFLKFLPAMGTLGD